MPKKQPEQKFQDNQYVRLKPFEDQPEEYGIVDGYEGNNLYVVTIDKRFRGPGDDGIREVDQEQLEAAKPKAPFKRGQRLTFKCDKGHDHEAKYIKWMGFERSALIVIERLDTGKRFTVHVNDVKKA